MNSKHIGIVAVSAEGAALCYQTICREGADLMGRHNHPEVSLHTIPLATYMKPFEAGNDSVLGELLSGSAAKLRCSGAEFFICPDNTAHSGFAYLSDSGGEPWLHIAEEVAKIARQAGYKKLGILGTRYLMEGRVYPAKLEKSGIDWQIPAPEQRERINTIIFDELVYGKIELESKSFFLEVISELSHYGCDAVVLGCTEIPLIVRPTESSLPTLDSTRILAQAALNFAVE